jgi:Tn3 transposase DDE domain
VRLQGFSVAGGRNGPPSTWRSSTQISDHQVLLDDQAVLRPGASIAGPAAQELRNGTLPDTSIDWLKTHFFTPSSNTGSAIPSSSPSSPKGKMRAKIPQLREALQSRFTIEHHGVMVAQLLAHIDTLVAACAHRTRAHASATCTSPAPNSSPDPIRRHGSARAARSSKPSRSTPRHTAARVKSNATAAPPAHRTPPRRPRPIPRRPKRCLTRSVHINTDVILGLFRLLGYQFSSRLADAGGARFWRLEPAADYGPLNHLARHPSTQP